MVATDIVSRGIDIDELSHVVNFDVPNEAADYVHRIGRTARAGKDGAGITFISPDDQVKFTYIEKLIEREVDKYLTPEEIGKSPEWDPEAHRNERGYGGGNRRRGKGGGGNRNRGNNKKRYSNKNRNRKGGSGGGNRDNRSSN